MIRVILGLLLVLGAAGGLEADTLTLQESILWAGFSTILIVTGLCRVLEIHSVG
tara:strand:+ start:6442 stop:6603 length:162 start_codon:yes stop_codon:yes gene_type:complete